MRVIILYVSLLVIASGCSSSKRAGKTDMLKDAPEWVQQTPNTPSYYHGIGMIYKSGVQNYRERARQVALFRAGRQYFGKYLFVIGIKPI